MTTPSTSPLSLEDAWAIWLQQPKHLDASRLNASRSASDRANHKRALLDFALGASGQADLSRVPLSLFALELNRVLQKVTAGARLRSAVEPSPRQLTTLHSWTRRLRDDLRPLLARPDVAPTSGRQLRLALVRNRYLPGFRYEQWPEGLRQAFDALALAYTDDFYSGPGHEFFNRHAIRTNSLKGYSKALNQLVRFCVQEEHLDAPTLPDLIDRQRVARYRAWYLAAVRQGGYRQFDMTCQALACVSRYLVASGQMPCEYRPNSRADLAPWMVFYALGRSTYAAGVERNAVATLEDLPLLSGRQLREIAWQARTSPPRVQAGRYPTVYQQYIRERSAMIYFLLSVVPLRFKNVLGLRWGQHLLEIRPGVWHLRLQAHELKNGKRRKGRQGPQAFRTMHLDLPQAVTSWIAWWRSQLQARLGEGFDAVTPFVFPMRRLRKDPTGTFAWGPSSEKSVRDGVEAICLELRGHRFRMHRFRHCVATDIINRNDARVIDLQQAATLLGDQWQTVVSNYNRPDEQALLNRGYFAAIDKEAAEAAWNRTEEGR